MDETVDRPSFEYGTYLLLRRDLTKATSGYTQAKEAFEIASQRKILPGLTALDGLNVIRQQAQEQLESILRKAARADQLNTLVVRYVRFFCSLYGGECVRSERRRRERTFDRTVALIRLQEYVFRHQRFLLEPENRLSREVKDLLPMAQMPFIQELGQACVSFLYLFRRPKYQQSAYLYAWLSKLFLIEDSFSSVTDFQNCQESAVHKVAAISIAGQEMLGAVMRIQAINNARPSSSGNNPQDYLSLDPSASPLEPELCHSIVEVARNYGRVLGLPVDRNPAPALGIRQHQLYNVSSSNPSDHSSPTLR